MSRRIRASGRKVATADGLIEMAEGGHHRWLKVCSRSIVGMMSIAVGEDRLNGFLAALGNMKPHKSDHTDYVRQQPWALTATASSTGPLQGLPTSIYLCTWATIDTSLLHWATINTRLSHWATTNTSLLYWATTNTRLLHWATINTRLLHWATINTRLLHWATINTRLLHWATINTRLLHWATINTRYCTGPLLTPDTAMGHY